MDNALMIGMQTQMVLRRRMEAVANNIANVATTGFKADNFAFEMDESDGATSTAVKDVRFVREAGLVRDMSAGAIAMTGNPFDVAVEGPGFFAIQGDTGTLYTRDGNFVLAADGRIVTQSGRAVLSEGGAPITLDLRGERPVIDKTGAITVAGVEAGKLGIYQFESPEGLEKVGENAYQAAVDQPATVSADSRVIQGALEGSNVKAVVELTRLIEISRAYESASRMVNGDDELRKAAIEKLGRA